MIDKYYGEDGNNMDKGMNYLGNNNRVLEQTNEDIEDDLYDTNDDVVYYPYPKDDDSMLTGQCVPEEDYIDPRITNGTINHVTASPDNNDPGMTIEPTNVVTASPTSEPTQSPTTPNPTQSPTVSSKSSCQDTTENFLINSKQRTCSWVGQKNRTQESILSESLDSEFMSQDL